MLFSFEVSKTMMKYSQLVTVGRKKSLRVRVYDTENLLR